MPSATNTSPASGNSAIRDLIELVSKAALGFAAACLVCGILVVNLALREFGVASFGLFRVNYITAGVWTFSPIGFAGLLVGFLLLTYYRDEIVNEKPPRKISRLRKVGKMAVSVFTAGIVVVWFLSRFGIAWDWRWVIAILVGMVVGAMAVAVPVTLRFAESQRDKLNALVVGFTCVVVFLWYLLLLAPSLYRSIPASVGGGAGTSVVFIVPPDKQEVVRAAGLSFSGPLTTDRVTLLLESEKEYVVVVEGEKTATTLKADMVSAVRHFTAKK